ncbi:MAG: hypothetical protein L0H83_16015, partial [Salinisphaera sp.]|nr:hypothetical protein [Salinisphaera sp.]
TRMGYPMAYDNVSQVFDEMVTCMPNYANLSYDVLGDYGKWYPYDGAGGEGTMIVFDEDFPRGRGLLKPADISQPYDMVDDEYRYVLATGRTLEHWHTGVMTRRSKALDALSPVAFAEIHPDDAAQIGVGEGDYLSVTSRRGNVIVEARITTDVSPGSLFMPMHFREAGANALTAPEVDPDGKIPDFKFVAVKMARAEAAANPVERLEAEGVEGE